MKLSVLDLGKKNDSESPGVDETALTAELMSRHHAHFREEPFFLMYAPNAPHAPLAASTRGESLAGLYGDAVEELDASVGHLMGLLERDGRRAGHARDVHERQRAVVSRRDGRR